jgi:hypothetical protein
MARARVAPWETLTRVLEWYATANGGNFAPKTASFQARRELRAMTNALKVATRERRAVLEVARYGRTCHQGEIDGDWIGRMLEDSDERMACALLRLERLSRGGKRA